MTTRGRYDQRLKVHQGFRVGLEDRIEHIHQVLAQMERQYRSAEDQELSNDILDEWCDAILLQRKALRDLQKELNELGLKKL